MKKLLVAGITAAALCGASAFAADMPMKAPMAPTFSWTGCYIGANVGGAWGRDSDWDFTLVTGSGGNPHYSGVMGGGQVGCDVQSGPWVFGVEGMFDWGNLKGHSIDPANPAFAANTKVSSLDTATARIGYAWDRSLFYVDGGAAWAHHDRFFVPAANPTVSDTSSGAVVGVGFESMFAPNWSWKIEYDHAWFGKTTEPVSADPTTTKQNIDTVLLGINYHFGTGGKGPVVAKY
jgi:outer membrane immunogenic protein